MSESKQEWLQRVADMHGLDVEDIEEIAEMCLEDTDDNITVLDNLGDMSEAVRAAHSIKGSTANIGQMPLSDAAKAIENDLKDGSVAEISARLTTLKATFDDFKTLMKS